MRHFLIFLLLLKFDIHSEEIEKDRPIEVVTKSDKRDSDIFDFNLLGEDFVKDLNNFDRPLYDFIRVLNIIKNSFVKEVSYEDLFKGALDGMLKSLNMPYSSYMSEKDYEYIYSSYIDTSKDKSNIGIVPYFVEGSKYMVVIDVEAGSVAEEANILRGDIITKINRVDISKMSSSISNILATKSKISLTIKREEKILEKKLTKRDSKKNIVDYKIIDGVGYIGIKKFSLGIGDEFKKAFIALKDRGAEGIILDLRDNGGGTLKDAVEIASIFLDGDIVKERSRDREKVYRSLGSYDINIPLIVLINRGSASGSEIIAGAIKDNKRGLIIGERSFGKGSFQVIFPIDESEESNRGGVKLDVSEFFTPKGNRVNGVGVNPNLTVGSGSSIYSLFNSSANENSEKIDSLESAQLFSKKVKNINKEKQIQMKSAIIFMKTLKGDLSSLIEE